MIRGVARLSTSGRQERNISSFFLIFLLFSPYFPQFFFIFFLNLVLQVGGSPIREGLGYTTANDLRVIENLVSWEVIVELLELYNFFMEYTNSFWK